MAEHATYHPRDAIHNTVLTGTQTTVIGALIAGVQNTLRKQNVGAMGVLTHSGHLIAVFGTAGVAYQFTKDAAANLRRKDDTYNEAMAGFAAGATTGIFRRSLPYMLGAGALFATGMATFNYVGGIRGVGDIRDQVDDDGEVERREELKKVRRRPLSETLEQLGEGRGIYGPGWEERRRQRLLEKYGIDVKAAQEAA
ncbi:NADH-ubiquinone oxidoreductase a subunit [Pyrenophora tritici-repentis]|uniref:NADH-ubiquinone oxidoreductase protein n=2 Tax=Pyrenophora tritici-repentis TaxID=45151 RepID=A0A2W1G5X1_9PLEO|nr:NADH-ubiquinone oxidoreductase 213 kDa subunit [Pyrenophora tritici-repentis Pt-1C-BFP]KAA8622646.1 NADH-ubiquinone oxidoreductase [Pyrenophora tritici-repentis]EDU45777.1 NADH-ubiquinone oxidoreductase 213 kDa subunit [Pyrenophora tritici-repentis Pt-1C-BFP]KAF7451637.1 NADH-ubiquinone oxidoreductase protein [Pyrenophora tritici-repentis]KAF7575255.1 Tim17 domain containing protein [Pyrenophora tritici-repentis]KAG9385993.1 NADH-ubiquinone oxidoreductase protein [Pyrenophora tritici-repent